MKPRNYVRDDDPDGHGNRSSANWGCPRWAVCVDGSPVAHAYSKKGAEIIAQAFNEADD